MKDRPVLGFRVTWVYELDPIEAGVYTCSHFIFINLFKLPALALSTGIY